MSIIQQSQLTSALNLQEAELDSEINPGKWSGKVSAKCLQAHYHNFFQRESHLRGMLSNLKEAREHLRTYDAAKAHADHTMRSMYGSLNETGNKAGNWALGNSIGNSVDASSDAFRSISSAVKSAQHHLNFF